jgi:TRAP-type C4-dicarboxylate transport system permease small subunit
VAAIERLNHLLNKILMIGAGVAVVALMLIAGGNVVLRLAGVPFRGAYELVGFSGAIVIAFAMGTTQKRKCHVMVDILAHHFPDRVNLWLDRVQYLITTVFFLIVARQVGIWGMTLSRSGELSETLKIAYYPFVHCVSLGFAVLSLTLLLDFIATFRRSPEQGIS